MKYQNVGQRLQQYYFSKEMGGDEPVCCIDVSNSELATALGCSEGKAEDTLLAACHEYARIYKLGNPYLIYSLGNLDMRGTVIFLLVACKVAQKAGENDSKDFQSCLKDTFNYPSKGHPPYCLNLMWNKLVSWCNNEPRYRKIQLPNEVPSRKHIGKTQDITFPTWRDESTLKAMIPFANRYSLHEIERDLLATSHFSSKATPAFREFFLQYIDLLKEKAPQRYDTLFGRFLCKFFNISHPNFLKENPDPLDLILVITNRSKDKELFYGDYKWTNVASGLRALGKKFAKQSTLRKQLANNFLLFEKTGYGEYTATCSPEVDTIIMAYRENNYSTFARYGTHDLGGQWFLTNEMNYNKQEVRELIRSVWNYNESYFCLEGGLRRRFSILRHDRLLPQIKALRDGEMRIGVHSLFKCHAGKLYSFPKNLKNDELPIYIYGTNSAEKTSRIRNIKVYDIAPITPISKLSDWAWAAYEEFQDDRKCQLKPISGITDQVEPCTEMKVLQEALYFTGQSGWNTKELINLFRLMAIENGPSPWDILRSFVEGGWLTPYWARRYGTMRFQLVRPHFVKFEDKVLLWGARPQSIVECFKKRVESRGGTVSVCNGVGAFSPSILCASGVRLAELEKSCTEPHVWGIVKEFSHFPFSIHKDFWPKTSELERTDLYKPTSYWNWKKGAFSKYKNDHRVELKIMKHLDQENGCSKRKLPIKRHKSKIEFSGITQSGDIYEEITIY